MAWRRLGPLRYLVWIWLAWLLLGNLALNTGLAEVLINRKPDAFQMQWRHGLTLWPGQAWLWQSRLQGQERHLRWQLRAERVGGRLSLLPLFVKQAWFPSISAHGVHFELDQVEHEHVPPPPRAGGWTVRLSALYSDSVLGVRVGDVHLDGRGQARFGLVKQLRSGPLEILPSNAHMADARLRLGDEIVAEMLDWTAELAMARHRPERAPGWSRLGLVDAHLRLTGRSAGLAVNLDADGRWRTHLARAEQGTDLESGRIELDLAMHDGTLRTGGRVDIRLPLLASEAEAERKPGWAQLTVAVDEDIKLHLSLPPPPGDGGHIDAGLTIAGRALPLSCTPATASQSELGPVCRVDHTLQHQLERVAGDIRLRWHFDSLRWLGPLLVRAPWLHLHGSGKVEADVRIEQGGLAAGSWLRVPALSARIDVLDNQIEGQARADARIESSPDGTPMTRLAVVVERFKIAAKDVPDQVQVRGGDLHLDIDASGPLTCLWPLDEQVAEGGSCSGPATARSLRAHLRFNGAEVPELGVYNRYLPPDGVRLLGGQGRLSSDLHIDLAGEVGHGRIALNASAAQLAIADLELQGDVALETRLQGADLEQRSFDLDGSTLRLDNVRALDGERMLGSGWWLHARLDRGRLQWRRPLQIDAQVQARARDIALLLDLFAQRKHYPRWALRLLDAGEARLNSRVRMNGSTLRLEPLHAENDRFDVRARLAISGRKPTGDLLLGWGHLHAGLELAAGERHWQLRRPSEWFDSRAGDD